MSEITRLLDALERGDGQSSERLLPLVYEELRRLATAKMAQESAGHTLQATALVHEAYVRLVGDGERRTWDNRGHFFAAAAKAMRRILVENARRKGRVKHGGGRCRIALADVPETNSRQDEVLALDEALTQLTQEDPMAAKVVELHYFAGMSHEQVAAALDLTVYRARQKWTYARAWLRTALQND